MHRAHAYSTGFGLSQLSICFGWNVNTTSSSVGNVTVTRVSFPLVPPSAATEQMQNHPGLPGESRGAAPNHLYATLRSLTYSNTSALAPQKPIARTIAGPLVSQNTGCGSSFATLLLCQRRYWSRRLSAI